MKNLFTLAATGFFAAASFGANAQFTVDGRASAAEISTTPVLGKYQLASSYTAAHLFPDRGLKALYVGYTATTLNIMLVGSPEAPTGDYRAFILYLNTPARTGAPAGVQLAGSSDGSSPLAHRPTMDMQVDYGFRGVVGGAMSGAAGTGGTSEVYFSAVSYVTGAGAPAVGSDPYAGQGSKAGAVVTAAATATVLPGAKYSYFNTANLTANTAAINGGVEIEIPLSALGGTPVTVGSRLDLFAAYTDSNGEFVTYDVIPQITGRTTALGANPNFTTIPGNQSVAFVLGTGPLASRNEVANAANFQVYPNPAQAGSTIAYTVAGGQQPVSVAVYNALGQLVRSVANEMQAGAQQFPLGRLAAGSYLVKLQIGEQTTSRKIVVN